MNLVIHERTQQALQNQVSSPAQGILLLGSKGLGKFSLALWLTGERHAVSVDELLASQFVLHLTADKTQHISIDAVRTIEHFLSRRIPVDKQRTIIIEDAGQLTLDAQNAILKMLEEPPERTHFILTADSTAVLLSTISSRVIPIHIIRPDTAALDQHFTQAGYDAAAIGRAQLMSGSLPGLMHTILDNDTEHPLVRAAALARECIQKTSFERLAMVDALSKDRQLSLDVLAMLQQMAHVSLAAGNANPIWKPLLAEAYTASELLQRSAQPKLVLTNLMLKLTV